MLRETSEGPRTRVLHGARLNWQGRDSGGQLELVFLHRDCSPRCGGRRVSQRQDHVTLWLAASHRHQAGRRKLGIERFDYTIMIAILHSLVFLSSFLVGS